MAALYLFRCKTFKRACVLCVIYIFLVSLPLLSLTYSIFSLSLSSVSPTPLDLSSTSLSSCTPVLVQTEAKEMSGVSSISLGNCDSVFSSVRLNHLPLEERWGGPYPGPKSNLNPQRLLKPLQVISIQTHGKSTNTHKHLFCCSLSFACTFLLPYRMVDVNRFV